MKIIGLTGKMGAGKSTVIQCLKDIQHAGIEVVKFAEPLYLIQEQIYDIIRPVYTRPEDFVKDRKLLQFIGTDWGRETISKTMWTDLWRKKVNGLKEQEEYHRHGLMAISDDTRFDNEAEVIKSLGGVIIQVKSDKTLERINTAGANHSSENGVDLKYIDAIIENNGTIQDLKDSLLTLNSMLHLW